MADGMITGRGVRELKSVNLKQGHTYYLGASSSPDLIYLEDINGDKVTYRKRPYYPEDRLTRQRDVTEDLIAQGNETQREKRERMMERYDDYAEKTTNYIDRDTNLKEIQRREIVYRVMPDLANQMDDVPMEIERRYRSKYGLETNLGVRGNKPYTYRTTVNRDQVGKIRDLEGIKVLESNKP